MGDGRLLLRSYGQLQAAGTAGVGILQCLIERLCSAHPTAGGFLGSGGIFSTGFPIPANPAVLGFSALFPSCKEVFFFTHLPFLRGGALGFWLLIVFLAQLWLRLLSATDGLHSLGHVP